MADDKYIFQLRRGFKKTDANGNIIQDDWSNYEELDGHVKPLQGELVIEYENDIPKLKVGDGEHEFSVLPGIEGHIVDQVYSPTSSNPQSGKAVAEAVDGKQDKLVSGTNIKTVNGQDILGSGNIQVSSNITVDQVYTPTSSNPQSGKAVAEALQGIQTGESGTIVIDQVYTPESENAQSGKAVAQVIGTVEERIQNIDGIIPIEFEKGSFNNTTGAETNSNYVIRTKQFIKASLVGSIKVNSGYQFRGYFYNQDKTFNHIGSWNSFNANKSGEFYARYIISKSDGTTISPDEDHGFILNNTIPSFDKAIVDLNVDIENVARDITLEQGSISDTGGHSVGAGNYIRTKGFIPYDSVYKIRANDGYILKLYYYDENKTQMTIDDALYTVLPSGFGLYTIPYNGAKYIRISIQNEDKSNINTSTDVGLRLYGTATYRHEIYDEKTIRNIVEQLKPQMPIVTACLGNTIEFHTTNFGAVCITDLHGKYTALDDAYSLQQYLNAYYQHTTLPILNFGDNVAGRAKEYGYINNSSYMEKAIQYGVYHTIGQHEVGFYDTEYGRSKENCMTHEELFNNYIAPMKEVWGLPDLTTNYYCKDFDVSKMRLISLYQYNIPLIEENSTTWKYSRNTVWYGQEQLDWLVNTLNSTPDGYRVIILMHQQEAGITKPENATFFYGNTFTSTGIIDGTPIADIVEAYRNRTTLNKTYTCKDKNKYPESDFLNTVSADFTDAKGTFANYYTGDTHIDTFGTVGETSQVNLGITSSGQSYDCSLRSIISVDGRTSTGGNNPESTLLTVIGYDYSKRLIRVGRLGQQFSSDGQIRMYTGIKY